MGEEKNKKHTLFLADSRNLESFLRKDSVDLVLTGPPYANEVVYSGDQGQLSRLDGPDFLAGIAQVWKACHFALKPGGILAVWVHDFYRGDDAQYRPFHAEILPTFSPQFNLKSIVIWDRYLNRFKGRIPAARPLGTRLQYIILLQKDGSHPTNRELIETSFAKYFWNPVWAKKTSPLLLGSELLFRAASLLAGILPRQLESLKKLVSSSSTVYDPHAFRIYPTECPSEVADRLIKDFSKTGDTVLDPFLGSGTTMAAAAGLGRSCVGVEINEKSIPAVLSKIGTNNVTIVRGS